MDDTQYLELIGRYLAGECDAAEKAELLAWAAAQPANRELFDELTQLWGMSSRYEEEALQLDVAEAWQRVESRIEAAAPGNGLPLEEPAGASVIALPRWGLFLRYAAAALLLLAVGYWAFERLGGPAAEQFVELSTGPNEQQTHRLPDGSTVVLNENTRLSYALPFEERRAQLAGEAFFEIARHEGRPFAVDAGGAVATVLGTAFNLRAYPDETEVEVSVRSGKVAVEQTGREAHQVLLEAGQAAVYRKKEEILEKRSAPNADAWKTRQLAFDEARLDEVLETLRRYFKAEIAVSDPRLLNCRYNGEFVQAKEVEEVLKAMAFTMDLALEERGRTYYLVGDATSRCQ